MCNILTFDGVAAIEPVARSRVGQIIGGRLKDRVPIPTLDKIARWLSTPLLLPECFWLPYSFQSLSNTVFGSPGFGRAHAENRSVRVWSSSGTNFPDGEVKTKN